MDSLSYSLNSLMGIFKEAASDMKLDDHDTMMIADKVTPLLEKIDKVLEQNEKIAKGIVAIADMISEQQAHIPQPEKRIQSQPRYAPSPPPSYSPPPRPSPMPQQAPMSSYGPQAPHPPSFTDADVHSNPLPTMPSMPQDEKKKKGFSLKF
ncbi:MAG: hypothetical protein KKF44_05475 [Nanoarchaeota archaeon]|nr:hypothetical protein [Nanoarchaeota archaeon]